MGVLRNVFRKAVYILGVGMILSALCSCGFREGKKSYEAEGNGTVTDSRPVAVAEYRDWDVILPREGFWEYTLTGENFYALCPKYDVKTNTQSWRVIRNGLSREFHPEDLVAGTGNTPLTMLADGEDHVFLFRQEEEGFVLEKYDGDGELVWRSLHDVGELQDRGMRLREGVVVEEGVYLYEQGAGGMVFSFDGEGNLQGSYVPELPSLSGVAVGKDGRAYGYCISDGTAAWTELRKTGAGGEGKKFPLTPLQVWSGYEEGLFLHTGEGLWKYDPASGNTEMLWGWDEDYVNVEPELADRFFYDGERVGILTIRSFNVGISGLISIVRIGFEDGRDYPGKQTITMGRVYNLNQTSRVEELVRLYNRQSKEYKVEILQYDESEAYMRSVEAAEKIERQFVKGEAPDLMEISWLYGDGLASNGAFEDLTDYMETSEKVREKDLLDSVRQASRVSGKTVYVIPSFWISSMAALKETAPEDWTPQKFLEAAQQAPILSGQSKQLVFNLCMGIRYGERFVDYEKRKSYFDSEEFTGILEACGRVKEAKSAGSGSEADAWLVSASFRSVFSFANANMSRVRGRYWLGYPGWDGAETDMYPYDVFVMNSASSRKEGAWDFLEFLLSEELQDTIGRNSDEFPVRKDSFEKLLEGYTEFERDEEYGNAESKAPFSEADAKILRDQVGRGVFQSFGRRFGLREILMEETAMYFAGDVTLEKTVKKIQNRVGIYLKER